MKRISAFFLAVMLLLLTGCSENDRIYNNITENNPNKLTEEEKASLSFDPTGTLTIYYFDNVQHIKYLANRYMSERNNVEINFVNGMKDSEAEITAKLASGTAGDIIDLSRIDLYRYSGSGTFENLYKYMNEDESFDPSLCYEGIFKAMETDNRLLAVPYSFTFVTVRFNNNLLKAMDVNAEDFNTVNCYDIYDLYTKALGVSEMGENLNLSDFYMYQCELGSFFDPIRNIRDFSNFDNYLSAAKEIYEHKKVVSATLDNPYNDDLSMTDSQLLRTVLPSPSDMNLRNYYFFDERNSKPIPVSNSNGEIPFMVTSGPFAISSKSENKELAWDFLSYALSNIDYKDKIARGMNFHGFSINRDTNRQFYDRMNVTGKDDTFMRVDGFVDELTTFYYVNDGESAISNEIDKFMHGQNDIPTTTENCIEVTEKYMGR